MAAKRPFKEPNDFHRKKKSDPSTWHLSESALEKSTIGATIAFSIILVIIWFLRASFLVDQSDIQTTVQIAAGLGAFSLAVPLFLRDFKVQKILWKSFLILSSIFLISTFIGTVAYLLQSNPEEVRLIFIGVISVIAVSNLRTAMALQRLRLPKNVISVHIGPSTPWEFFFVIVLSFVCILTSSGLIASFLILFSYGLMMLFATLAASIISVLSYQDNHSRRLKNAVQDILEENPDKAFTMPDLLSALREGLYNGESELVSQSILEDAVREMDIEGRKREPKATFFNGKIISRWNDDYREQIFRDMPFILVFESRNYHGDIKDVLSELRKNYSEELLDFLSQKSGLSIELLEDGNVLNLFLPHFDGFWEYNIVESFVTIAYIKDCVEKVKNDKESKFSPSFEEVLKVLQKSTQFKGEFSPLFDEVEESFYKPAWFYSEKEYWQKKIILRFVENLFSSQIKSFIQLFSKKIEDKEFLEMFYQHSTDMELGEIGEHFAELLRKKLPGLENLPRSSFLGKLAECAIDSYLEEKLGELSRIGELKHIVLDDRTGAVKLAMGESDADFWRLNIDEKN